MASTGGFDRLIRLISAAHKLNPSVGSPVMIETVETNLRALAQSGQTMRPVIVSWNGTRMSRSQSGHLFADKLTLTPMPAAWQN